MASSDSTTRVCSICGEEKPLSEYYFERRKNRRTPYYWCKACHKTRINSRPLANSSSKEAVQKGEIDAIAYLRSHGIYAASGKASEYKYTDVVAWGCVRVEVKTSGMRSGGSYDFTFSFKQIDERLNADVIMLVCYRPYETTHHIFPSDHPVFYTDGQLKRLMIFNPHGNTALSSEMMDYHQDALSHIEDARLKMIERLKSGG